MESTRINGRLQADEVKRKASGRWIQILQSVCRLTDSQLNPKVHGPCPQCGGADRFRALDDVAETGGLYCNQCFSERNGDGLSAIQWLNDCTFSGSLKLVDEFLGGNYSSHIAAAKPAAALKRKSVNAIEPSYLKSLEVNSDECLETLAEELRLGLQSLKALGVGFDTQESVWTFPERNADGIVCGLNRRYPDGEKKMMFGHKRGLYFADTWRERPGPVLIVEGGSDTAAAITLGLAAIGRPSAIVPGDVLPELVELLKLLPSEREIIVLGECDEKSDGKWPGRDGAIRTSRELTEALGRPIAWALPKPAKDLRCWLTMFEGSEFDGPYFTKSLERIFPESAGATTSGRSFAGKAASDLWDLADQPVQWLVENVFSVDQPTIFGAKQKSLKTTLLTDLAVSLASGLPWLGKFDVPQKRRVLFVTGEASEAAAIRKVRRAADSRNLRREDFTDSLRIEAITFPTLPSEADCQAVAAAVTEHGIEVVLLDPLYMGLQGLNTSNLTEVGPAMRQFMTSCRPANVIIAHHVKKTASFDDAPNLEDLSQAGIAEFAGNYWLMGRMGEYTGNGLHSLAVRYGGRDEQFGLLKLDFDERAWTANFSSLMDHREDQKARNETERVNAMTSKILTELKRYPDGISEAALATAIGTKRERSPYQTALAELEQRQAIVCLSDFRSGNKALCRGWKLAS